MTFIGVLFRLILVPTVDMFNPVLWTILEPDMAIICACLPLMRSLFTPIAKSPFYLTITSYFNGKVGHSKQDQDTPNVVPAAGEAPIVGGIVKRSGTSQISNWPSSGPFERLEEEEIGLRHAQRIPGPSNAAWAWPSERATESRITVGRGLSTPSNDIPLGAIGVKTVVGWRETSRDSLRVPHDMIGK